MSKHTALHVPHVKRPVLCVSGAEHHYIRYPSYLPPFDASPWTLWDHFEKSSAGHRYILSQSVTTRQGTRKHSHFAPSLRPKVIHALIQLFSKVGIPEGDSNRPRYELHFPPDEVAPPATGYHRGENQSLPTHKPTDWWRDSIRH